MRYSFFVLISLALIACGTGKTTKNVNQHISSDSLFTLVQKNTFNYFWEGAEPNSGLAPERIHMNGIYPQNDQHIITSGGGGFGVMAILVGIERGFITRNEGLKRFQKIVSFLESADSYHGVWPHWWDGRTGKTKPFSKKDDGGDLVETAFMVQGLLCVRQYFKSGTDEEKKLANRIDKLWKAVNWDFYRNEQNVLYWHWSPNYAWEMNFPLRGYNECLITYILAASSPTFPVNPEVYHEGWAGNGAINDSTEKYGYKLRLSHNGAKEFGGPLFWSHYSYLALDPRGLKDRYADYFEEVKNHTLINRAWCIDNPGKFAGYGAGAWGLTASYSVKGYSAHAPGLGSDLGVISPTAALSSMPYTPDESLEVMNHLYETYGEKLFGKYGFYDAFSVQENWFPQQYLAIDQGPIVVMMENHRSGLLWKLFMSCPEIKTGLEKLGFSSPETI